MTRRDFTGRLSARIVWMGLILEAIYFFFLASRIAALARGVPGWMPDNPQPSSVVLTGTAACVLLLMGVIYFVRLFKIRGWFHYLAPLFLVYGLFALAMSGALTQAIYGEFKGGSAALNALSGFGFMLIGVFSIIAHMFMPKSIAVTDHVPLPATPADRPEP